MEVLIDKENANIVNSDEVINQINRPKKTKRTKAKTKKKTKAPEQAGKKTKAPKPRSTSKSKKSVKKDRRAVKSHGSKCKCCICRGLKKGKKLPAQFSMQPIKLRPCICGSIPCKKDWEKIDQEQRSHAAVKLKKCVCGSHICAEESSKMPELLLEGARQAQHDKKKAKKDLKKKKLYQKARKKRAEKQKKKYKKQTKQRIKEDKRALKRVKSTKDQGNIGLIAESLIDLGSFGSKAFCDVARTLCRAVRYPKDAYHDVRDVIRHPGTVASAVYDKAEGLGLIATLTRITQRILQMPAGKRAVTRLESYPATNYLVHLADGDPKKRMKKFPKPKRVRKQVDFECSLYMASMRKRPCLLVYRMCPWFYPHFMSLLNVWKQFTDVLLFLLAVLVWSPCILCMEICRACVCCCMCQA